MRAVLVLILLGTATAARADAPCETARARLAKKDLVRASIAAADCADPEVAAAIARRAAKAGYSPVEIVTRPAGGTVVVEAAADAPFTAPRQVWLPEGRHQVTGLVDGQPVARVLVIARDGDRALALIEMPAPTAGPTDGSVDFTEEGPGESSSGPPPKQEFPSLLRDKYRRGLDSRIAWSSGGAVIPRPPTWRLVAGPTLASVDGERAVGGSLDLSRGFAIFNAPLYLTPGVGGAVARTDMDTVVRGEASLLLQVEAPLGRRIAGRLGLGPLAAVTPNGDGGVGAGGVVDAEIAQRRGGLALAARGTLATDARTVTVLLGARW